MKKNKFSSIVKHTGLVFLLSSKNEDKGNT
jgi:hypothetical protein